MGGKTSRMFKGSNPNPAQDKNQDENYAPYVEPERMTSPSDALTRPDQTVDASPFVRYRKGSMYMDEDGDLAHEFYVETKEGSNLTLKQISNNRLTPQGDVLLDVPCIRSDYPVILLDQIKVKE